MSERTKGIHANRRYANELTCACKPWGFNRANRCCRTEGTDAAHPDGGARAYTPEWEPDARSQLPEREPRNGGCGPPSGEKPGTLSGGAEH